jgi:hypothetical protein
VKSLSRIDSPAITPDEDGWISQYTFPVYGPDPEIHLFIWADTQPIRTPKTGLSAATPSLICALRPLESDPVSLTLTNEPLKDDECRFWEIDPYLMPGLYGLQIHPHLRPKGYTYIYLAFSGTYPCYLELHGVCYDPHDAFALGLETWIRSSCHENLSSGLRISMPSVLRPLLSEWLAHATQV